MKTILFILLFAVASLQAAVLTKTYRCNANPEKVCAYNPEERQTGYTSFSPVFYPYYFETDSLDEMQAWVAENKITVRKNP
jgi:hypothetical protein